jgi:hypothetical protein
VEEEKRRCGDTHTEEQTGTVVVVVVLFLGEESPGQGGLSGLWKE